ncbi:MAG: C39 family peptidase [Lachnospiraceae bacterium]
MSAVAGKVIASVLLSKDKDGNSLLKKLPMLLLSVFIVILFIVGAIFQPLAELSDGETLNNDYDITKAAIYKEVAGIYNEYTQQLKTQLEEEAKHVLQEKAAALKETPGKLDQTFTADIRINHVSLNYVMAFVSVEKVNDSDFEHFTASKKKAELLAYFKEMNQIKVIDYGERIEVFNEVLMEEQILNLFYREDSIKQAMFQESAQLYRQFISSIKESEDWYISERVFKPGGLFMEIPLYYQWADPWRNYKFGGKNIATSGCSVTCLAMVFSYLKEEEIYPDQIAAYAKNKWYVPPAGQGWGIFPGCSKQWNVECSNIGKSVDQVVQALEKGEPVIASMRPGTFTKGGHFIVLRGITENGMILVNDPNDNFVKNFAKKEFALSLIAAESKNFWKFSMEESQ